MRNFFYRVTGAIARFMYGRNGTDQLNAALLAAYLLVWLVQILLGRNQTARLVLEAVSLALAFLVLFRTFSRNLPKRRAENAKFLNWWQPIKNRFAAAHSTGAQLQVGPDGDLDTYLAWYAFVQERYPEVFDQRA